MSEDNIRFDIYKEVLFLKKSGLSEPEICRKLGMHQNQVKMIINQYNSLTKATETITNVT